MKALWFAIHFPELGFETHLSTTAEDSFSPSRAARLRAAPAEGSFMRGASPSRSPAEGSFMRGASPSRSPAEGSCPKALVENRLVVQVDALAQHLGLETGMTLATAIAIVNELTYFERDLDRERQRLAWLGLACYRYSSRVSVAPPASLLVEAGGSLHLFGGLQALASALHRRLRRLGHAANIAAAETPAAALALARAGMRIAAHDMLGTDAASALRRVPLACADIPQRLLERLANMGLRSLGQLLELPKQEIGKRFGDALVDYLDRLTGSKADPRQCIEPPERFRSTLHLPQSVDDKEALFFPMRRLAVDLKAWLAARRFGIETLTWEFKPLRGEATHLAVRFAAPTAEHTAFLALSRLRLERAQLPREVMGIALAADAPTPFAPPSADLLAQRHASATRAELIDRLAARLGDEAVQALTNVDDHRPERAWGSLAAAVGLRRSRTKTEAGALDWSSTAGPVGNTATAKRRPLWLLDVPAPIAPEDFTLLAGPERIETGWWDSAEHRLSRDYFIAVANSGAQCWIYRQREPCHDGSKRGKGLEASLEAAWYLHGYFS